MRKSFLRDNNRRRSSQSVFVKRYLSKHYLGNFLNYLRPNHHRGAWRVWYYLLVLLVVLVAALPILQRYVDYERYSLDNRSRALVGIANQNLSKKFSYDVQKRTYVFNANQKITSESELPVEVQLMRKQIGGGGSKDNTLYSVDLPVELNQGIAYFDNNLGLSFKLIPDFKIGSGKLEQGRVIYDNLDGVSKTVFTAKTNGIKEDIVFSRAPEESELTLIYKLELPDTLVARQLNDGGIGIYSADPSLYKISSYGSGSDIEKIKSARLSGEKTNLVFALPPPYVKQMNGKTDGQVRSRYILSHDTKYLTVDVSGLASGLSYPLTIDPSVVITSSSDFLSGNNEGNIDYPTDKITAGGLTGGSTGTWSTTNSLATARSYFSTVSYNGYMYAMGGSGDTGDLNSVEYAPINTNGTVGSWSATTTFTDPRVGHTSVAYNGYVYLLGGVDSYGDRYNVVQYAQINANGTLGAWSTTTAFATPRAYHTSAVYNGYMYVFGGSDGAVYYNDVQYAPVNANGSLGAWSTTTAFSTTRAYHAAALYNGYLYVIGGVGLSDVQYALVNANGTVGTWTTTTALGAARTGSDSFAYNGYLYTIGGYVGGVEQNDVQYAPINANGTIGAWATTSTFTTGRSNHCSVVYKGYLYVLGGYSSLGQALSDVQYSPIDSPGTTNAFATTTTLSSTRTEHSVTAYNGYMYSTGGYNGSDTTEIRYASINASGTLGTWNTTTLALSAARRGHTAIAYNGKMYIIGGWNGSTYYNTVQYADIASNGNISGSWTSSTFATNGRYGHAALISKGYMYVVGGQESTGSLTDIRYASLAGNGTFGTWASTTSTFTNARRNLTAVVADNFLYIIGGWNGTTSYNTIYYKDIGTDGNISGTWSSTTFTNARYGHASVLYNGYLYILGGYDGTTYYNNVAYAPVNTDGTLGSWLASTAFTTGRYGHAATTYGGNLYILGGLASGPTYKNDVQYARINNSGSGTLGAAWTAGTDFTTSTARRGVATVANNGYLYVMGGNNSSTYYSDVYVATINVNGSLGSFAATTSFAIGRLTPTAVAYNGYMYVLGGYDGTTYYADVQRSAINSSNGTLGAFTTLTGTPFTNGRRAHTSFAYNGYLYVVGGYNGTTYYSDVQYSAINADGSLGGFSSAGASFTNGRQSHTSVLYNGYLYVMGGKYASVYYNDVQYIALNSNGTLNGSWKYTNSIHIPRYAGISFAYNGYVYVMGGLDSASNYRDDVQFAPIQADGTIGNWVHTTVLPDGRYGQGVAVYNGYLYIAGGYDGTTYFKDTDYISLNSMPRIGMFSKVVDIGHSVISGITFGGSLSSGAKSITYKVADDTGVFGSTVYAGDDLPGGLPAVCSSATTTTPTRYVYLTATINDSSKASFPDIYGARHEVTDITVLANGLRAPTNYRLMHGKLFKSEVQQPLDTCKQ